MLLSKQIVCVRADGGILSIVMVLFDEIKAHVGWDKDDQARLAQLRRWLDSDTNDLVEGLGEKLAQFRGVQPMMGNPRFALRLRGVLLDWLEGLLSGTFDDAYVERRRAFGGELAKLDLSFEDVILLEGLVRKRLFELAQEYLNGQPREFSSTMYTLNKALDFDLALIHSSYLDARDAEMERALLDRFFAITGFSPTLYESLAEARGWNGE